MNYVFTTALAATETTEETHATTASTEHAAPEASGLAAGAQALGLDGRLLIAQIVNFVILLLILRKFLYGPLISFMENRRSGIEESLKKAEDIEQKYAAFQVEHEKRLAEAKEEAATIIADAKSAAEGMRAEALTTTQVESDKMLAKAALQIEQQKTQLLKDLKKEVGQLVVAATAQIISDKVAEKLDNDAIDAAIGKVKK